MNRLPVIPALAIAFCSPLLAQAVDLSSLPKCSTEKINRNDCAVFIDRKFPITSPTFSMYPGKHISVFVYDAFHFETVSLDPGTAQAYEGTDQGSGLVTAAIPNFKGLVIGSTVQGFDKFMDLKWNADVPASSQKALSNEEQAEQNTQAELDKLRAILKNDADKANAAVQKPIPDITIVYAQLKEVQSATPRPVKADSDDERRSIGVPEWTPKPWAYNGSNDIPKSTPTSQYARWRAFLLYEINGDDYSVKLHPELAPRPGPSTPIDVIGQITILQKNLPIAPTTPNADPTYPTTYIFPATDFTSYIPTVQKAISQLTLADDQTAYQAKLDRLILLKGRIDAALLADTLSLTKVKTDLQSYYWNINGWEGTPDQTSIHLTADKSDEPLHLGRIPDPITKDPTILKYVAPYRALGRQITYTVNVVNQIATLSLSVPTSTQKTAIATVTAVYADPHFEVSSGAFFSSLANRSFANVTTIKFAPGSPTPLPDDIRIVKTTSHPEVLPFVAANYRIGRERIWPGQRRFASYGTVAVALNPYNTLPEFAGGLSFSWRYLMLSPLYHLGHSTHLTQGLSNGQIWCVYGASMTSDPGPCTSSPPTPTTKTYWTNAIAFGISVRVPNVFNSTNH